MEKQKYVLGINTSNHDRSAALLKDGRIVCAISEERIDRRKHSQGFYGDNARSIVIPPMAAINYCLEAEKIAIDDLDLIVIGRSMQLCINDVMKYIPIKDKSKIVELPIPSHHQAHAYSSYFASGFEKSLILIIDEQGHWLENNTFEKESIYIAENEEIKELQTFKGNYIDISIGMFYDLFSVILGFTDGSVPAAGKLMGLASYGKKEKTYKLLEVNKEGNINVKWDNLIQYLKLKKVLPKDFELSDFKLNYEYKYHTILEEIQKYLNKVDWNDIVGQDIAYKAQNEIEEAIIQVVDYWVNKTGITNICLAGGVFLNSIVNYQILKRTSVKDIYIQPAATDDGTAIGYAYIGYYKILKNHLRCKLQNVYLGKEYTENEIENTLKQYAIPYKHLANIEQVAAKFISDNKIVAWYQGKSEFGPRALGNRSILASPLSVAIRDRINRDIKRRESFRPFAPSVLEEQAQKYFDLVCKSPYMLLIADVIDEKLDGIIHVDGTARVQTVSKEDNEIFYKLISNYGKISGTPVVLNTSFNVNGEPLVETPYDALKSFIITDIDILCIGNYLIDKSWFTSEEVEAMKWEFLDIQKDNYFKIGETLYEHGEYEEAIKYFKFIIQGPLVNVMEDSCKRKLFYYISYIDYWNDNLEESLEYIDKILNSITFGFNAAEMVKYKAILLNEMKIKNNLSRVQEVVSEMENKGIIKYLEEIS